MYCWFRRYFLHFSNCYPTYLVFSVALCIAVEHWALSIHFSSKFGTSFLRTRVLILLDLHKCGRIITTNLKANICKLISVNLFTGRFRKCYFWEEESSIREWHDGSSWIPGIFTQVYMKMLLSCWCCWVVLYNISECHLHFFLWPMKLHETKMRSWNCHATNWISGHLFAEAVPGTARSGFGRTHPISFSIRLIWTLSESG